MSFAHVAEAIHRAIDILTNDKTEYKDYSSKKAAHDEATHSIVVNIARHSNEDLQQVAAEYLTRYGQALDQAVNAVSGNDLKTLLVDLIIPRANFAARTVHNAITGAGTDEKAIIDVIVHEPKLQLDAFKQAYSNLFQKDLASKIDSDVSGHFGKAISAILAHGREGGFGNPESEAETLHAKGEARWGTDDDYFVNFFTQHSFESIHAVDRAYSAKYGHSLEVAIKKETSGSYEDLLVALVVSREVYWARRIREAIAGLGTDDVLLRRAFALNSKEQLERIAEVYPTVNPNKTLRKDVEDDTSGAYKDLYLEILKNVGHSQKA